MDTNEKRRSAARDVMTVEFRHAEQRDAAALSGFTRMPLDHAASIGSALGVVLELYKTLQKLAPAGGKEAYSALVPAGVSKALTATPGGSMLVSMVQTAPKKLTPVPVDPVSLVMAAALVAIDKRLDDVQAAQAEILDFLRAENEAGLRADLATLADVMQDYRFNWDNPTFCTNKHLQVQEIRRAAEKNLLLYQRQVEEALAQIRPRLTDSDQRSVLADVSAGFHYHRMSVYLYAFASFLEVTLLGNFRTDYLENVRRKVEDHDLRYRAFYTDCYDRVAALASGSVESKAVRRFAGARKAVGRFIGRLPLLRRGQLDEGLQASGDRLAGLEDRRAEAILEQFTIHSESGAQLFLEKLDALNKLFNDETEYIIDGENLYVRTEEV